MHHRVPSPSLPCPPPTPEAQADYARLVLAWDVWDSRDAAAALALIELLPPTEAAHFDLVETAKEVYNAISACYSTPSSAYLSRILMPFVFPNLGSFATQHPSELTIDLLETTLGKIESNLHSVASATDIVSPRLFEGCDVPQLHTFTATRASTAVSVSEDTAAVSAADRQKRGKGGKKRGKGVEAVEEVAVVEAALGAAVVAVAVVPQAEGALEEVLTRLLEEVRAAVVRGPCSSSHSRDSSSSGRHHNNFSRGNPHCSGVHSSTGALRHSGDLEDPGALAAAAALPAGLLAPRSATPAPATTGASSDRAVPGEFPDVLIPWIRAFRLQLRERFHEDLPVLRLHSDRGDLADTALDREVGNASLFWDTGAVDPGAGGAGPGGSPLPAPPCAEQTDSFTQRHEPRSRPTLPVCAVPTSRRVPRPRPPPVPGTHTMALRPTSVLLRVPLPHPPESSPLAVPDPKYDLARAASPTISRLLATVVTDPSESTAASALIAKLVDFAAACHLDYATALVVESESANPPSVRGECALGTDVLKDRQEDFECVAAALPRFASMLLAPQGDLDAPDILTPRSYAEALLLLSVAGSYGCRDGILEVHRHLRFSQRQGVDYFHTFSPTPKMTTLRVLLHVAAQRDYKLHSLDFSTAFL
ncbi:unnamed protein product [Closterium sp. NIES-53]